MRRNKRGIWIGLTTAMVVFVIGWLVYSHLYTESAIGEGQKQQVADKDEKAEDKNEQNANEQTASGSTEEQSEVQEQQEQQQQQVEETIARTITFKKGIKAPQELVALYASEGASVSWKEVKGADGYLVFRRKQNGKLKQVAETEQTSYIDTDVKENHTYRYRVCAVKKSGDQIFKGEMAKAASYFHTFIDPEKPMVALTFDDGPSIYTPEILKALKKYQSRATFLIVGERVSSYADTIKQANKQGCEIGSHSYNHPDLGKASKATIKSQLNRTEKEVKKVLGFGTPIMRPPYGSIGDDLRKQVGKPMILWSIDTLDWKTRNVKSTVKTIMSQVSDGDIILMHDLYSQSKDAAIEVIPKLINKGYQLVTVSEMAKYKGIAMEDGKAYTSMKEL